MKRKFETFYIWKTFILHSPLVDQMAGYKTQVLKYFPFTFLGHCSVVCYFLVSLLRSPVPFFFGSFKIFVFIVWKSQWCALIWVYFHLFLWLLTSLESCFPSVLGDFFLTFSSLHPFFLFYFYFLSYFFTLFLPASLPSLIPVLLVENHKLGSQQIESRAGAPQHLVFRFFTSAPCF